VPAVPRAEIRQAGGPAAGDQVGSQAATASPAVSATRAGNPRRMAHRAEPGHREVPATAGPVRPRRAGPAGHVHSRPAAPKKRVAGPAEGGQARRR
jgi:hypothetical protein